MTPTPTVSALIPSPPPHVHCALQRPHRSLRFGLEPGCLQKSNHPQRALRRPSPRQRSQGHRYGLAPHLPRFGQSCQRQPWTGGGKSRVSGVRWEAMGNGPRHAGFVHQPGTPDEIQSRFRHSLSRGQVLHCPDCRRACWSGRRGGALSQLGHGQVPPGLANVVDHLLVGPPDVPRAVPLLPA